MIAGCLGLDEFGHDDLRRLAALVRLPAGQRLDPRIFGRAMLVRPVRRVVGQVDTGQRRGWQVLLTGQLHNHQSLANSLKLFGADQAATYAAALDRWDDRADDHCVGHYAAIALSPDGTMLRLARSPFLAPPLHFRHDGVIASAAQHPRVLFWRESERAQPDLERVAQTLVNDASDRFRSWYRGACRLPLGTAVTLRPQGWHEIWRYDLFAKPRQRLSKPADFVEAAQALLDEGVNAALVGSKKPAIMLSGGLDSPLVAASALRQMATSQRLHSYTFGPDPAWSGKAPAGIFVSDFGLVESFAAHQPRLVPHFETNPGRDFRSDQRELLEASDAAPSMLGLAWIEHSLHRSARAEGCDLMLSGTWGNHGFSSRGQWAFSEYLLRGKWHQLAKAYRARVGDPRPLGQQFVGLSLGPLLPRWLWQAGRNLAGKVNASAQAIAVKPDWPGLERTLRRSRRAGYDFDRLQFANQKAHWRALLAEDGQEQDQYALGMELLYGLPRRDPTAYRPLVEFCWGCPTDVFMRDGTDRWLAREMARGQMPEAQRCNSDYGHHYTDWQPRLVPVQNELLDELERMADDPDISAVVDIPRLKQLVLAIPEASPDYDPQTALPYQSALPIGMAAARFIAYAKGRNDI